MSGCLGSVRPYDGPGDIVPGAISWWGLRAYSFAKIGLPAIRLREDGGNTEQDFVTVPGVPPDNLWGGLDQSAILAFAGGANLFVVTLYDQIGTKHLTQATQANQPAFITGGIGSLPVIRLSIASATGLATAASFPVINQPYSLSWVGKRTGSFTTVQSLYATTSIAAGWNSAADTAFIFAGSLPTATAIDNVWHAFANVYNSTNSIIGVDGVSTIVDALTNGVNSALEVPDLGGNLADADFVELGFWSTTTYTADNIRHLSGNQQTYYKY